MKKILITGASGFLGWNLCCRKNRFHRIYGTFNRNPFTHPNVTAIQQDFTDFDRVTGLIERLNPDGVIHTAAMASPDECEKNPAESYKINVEAAFHLGHLCSERKIPFVFTSTDLVFDGQNAPYNEEETPRPINLYGRQKLEAEDKLLSLPGPVVICRMALMYGPTREQSNNFFKHLINSLEKKQKIKLFTNEIRTSLGIISAVEGLFFALEHGKGLFHLAGEEALSRYSFGLLAAGIMGVSATNIIPIKQDELQLKAPRPANVSLEIKKARALGFDPLTLADELPILIGELKNGILR